MAGNDFMSKFRAGFKGTDKDKESLEMQEEAQKKEEDKKEKPSRFAKLYKKITGRK